MDKELTGFLKIFDVESFYDGPEAAYDWLYRAKGRNKIYDPRQIKSQFEELLKSRELSIQNYYHLTRVDFDDEDKLYEYLGKVYEYLFEGKYRENPPHPPYS